VLVLAGCGNPLDGLSVSAQSEKILITGGVKTIALEINADNENLKSATITADITGGARHLSRLANFTSTQPDKVAVTDTTIIDGKSVATITAIKPTVAEDSVFIRVTSRDSSQILDIVRVTVKKDIDNFFLKSAGAVGVPVGEPTVVMPASYFGFSPIDTSETGLLYTIDGPGASYSNHPSSQPITFSSPGVHTAFATSAAKPDMKIVLFTIRAYTKLTTSNVSLSRLDQHQPVITELTLTKNSGVQGANYAILQINGPAGEVLDISVTDSAGALGKSLWHTINQANQTIELYGTGIVSTTLNISVCVAGVINPQFLPLSLPVKVIDLPESIVFNSPHDSQPEITVYTVANYQSSGTFGQLLIPVLTPTNADDTRFGIRVISGDTSSFVVRAGNNAETPVNLDIVRPFDSNTKLWLAHTDPKTGEIELEIYAFARENNPYSSSLTRRITVLLKHGVQTIDVTSGLNSAGNTIALQLGAGPDRQIDFTPVPINADTRDIRVSINDPSIADIVDKEITYIESYINTGPLAGELYEAGRFFIVPKKAGKTFITFWASTGLSKRIEIEVVAVPEANGIKIWPADGQGSVVADTIPKTLAEGTLQEIHVSSSRNIQLQNLFTPFDSSVTGFTFTNAETAVASISNSSPATTWIFSRSSGRVVVTPTVYFKIVDENFDIVSDSRILPDITIVVYMPVSGIETSARQVQLYMDTGGRSPYTTELSVAELAVSVFPSVATTKASSAVWHFSGSQNYVRLVGASGGVVVGDKVKIEIVPNASLSGTYTATLVVTISDYNRVFAQEISVILRHSTPVSYVMVDNYHMNDGIYFEERQGLYPVNQTHNFTIIPTIVPSSATNQQIFYLVYDKVNDVWERKTGATSSYIRLVENQNGRMVIYPISAGESQVYVVAADRLLKRVEDVTATSLTNDILTNTDAHSWVRLNITVSNGSKENPYRINTVQDFKDINKAMDKHYELRKSIDMSGEANWTPIGTNTQPFTGTIRGFGNLQRVTGIRMQNIFSAAGGTQDEYLSRYGIFRYLGNSLNYATITNIEFVIEHIDVNVGSSGLSEIYIGGLAGEMRANLNNVSVIIKKVTLNTTNGGSTYVGSLYFGGIAGLNQTKVSGANTGVINTDVAILSTEINTGTTPAFIGGIAGINTGDIGNPGMTAAFNTVIGGITVSGNKASVGGIAGINGIVGNNDSSVRISGALTDGRLQNTNAGTGSHAGGIAGQNLGSISYSDASMRVSGFYNVGGIAGMQFHGRMEYCSFKAYDDNKRGADGFYLSASGNVGGLVGFMSVGVIKYSYAISYFVSQIDFIPTGFWGDIFLTGNTEVNAGGLVGITLENNTENHIFNSFSSLNVGVVSGLSEMNIGGLVGLSDEDQWLYIYDSYADCVFKLPAVQPLLNVGAIIGKAVGFVPTLSNIYAAIDGVTDPVGDGSFVNGTNSNVYIKAPVTDDIYAPLYYLLSDEDMRKKSSFVWFDFNSLRPVWIPPTAETYPQLLTEGGNALKEPVIEQFIVDVKDLKPLNDSGELNNAIAVPHPAKARVVLVYVKDASFSLADLINCKTIPEEAKANVRVSSSNSNIVAVHQSVSLDNVRLNVLATGTVVIEVVSRVNLSVKFELEICVIEGYSKFQLWGSVDMNPAGDTIQKDNYLNIKYGSQHTLVAQFTNSSTRVGAGVRVAVEDGDESYFEVMGASGPLSWTKEDDKQVVYLPASSPLIFNTLKAETEGIEVSVTPCVVGWFDKLGALEPTYVLISEQTVEFTLRICQGATSLAVTPDSAVIEPKDSQTVSLLAKTDKKDDKFTLEIWDGSVKLEEKDGVYGGILGVNWFDKQFFCGSEELRANIQLSLIDKKITKQVTYIIIVSIESWNGESIKRMFELTFIPQSVDRLDMVHFADAVTDANGVVANEIPGAGYIPSNTIVAGDFGLLRIDIAPYFADVDYVEITSSQAAGDVISFDQRIMYIEKDQFRYRMYQEGVSIIPNGIKITNLWSKDGLDDKDNPILVFDGSIYIRTVIRSATSLASSFTVTVRVVGHDHERTEQLVLAVDAMPQLTVTYPGYNRFGSAYIADGTSIGNNLTVSFDARGGAVSLVPGSPSIEGAKSGSGIEMTRDPNNSRIYVIYVQEGNIGSKFVVETTIERIVNGQRRYHTVEIPFTVVDIVIDSLGVKGVSGGVYSAAYAGGKSYPMEVSFAASSLRYNLDTDTNIDVLNSIEQLFVRINGGRLSGGTQLNYWGFRTGQNSNGDFTYGLPQHGGLTHVSKISGADDIGIYNYSPNGISNSENVRLSVIYDYNEEGELTLRDDSFAGVRLEAMTYFNFNFYQHTSPDSPIPVYNVNELRAMLPYQDYILLNDIKLPNEWRPLDIAINSLDGNGFNILFETEVGVFNRTDSNANNEQNLGLFSVVYENTLLKNITMWLEGTDIRQNAVALTTVNFGVIAGTNRGTITNCAVISDGLLKGDDISGITLEAANRANDTHNIGGLVGVNLGTITHSRVQGINITAYGNVAGLVAQNYSYISACYYAYGEIKNTASSNQTGNVGTSGLVGVNHNMAKIIQSYAGSREPTNEAKHASFIASSVRAAGFVYENFGTIEDCYSNMEIESDSRSSGFAFINRENGVINRSFSISKLLESLSAHTPFIGTEADVLNPSNNFNPTGVNDCFYLLGNFTVAGKNIDPAREISSYEFTQPDVFSGYGLSRNLAGAWHEFSGVWVIPNSTNSYFRIGSSVGAGTSSYIQLVAPNMIANPSRELRLEYSYIDPSTGQMVYQYSSNYGQRFEVTGTGTDNTRAKNDPFGRRVIVDYDPWLIYNAAGLNIAAEKDQSANDGIMKGAYRLIRDIDLNDLYRPADGSAATVLETTKYEFWGDFNGNGLSINNLEITIRVGVDTNSTGLFKSVYTPPRYNDISRLNRVDAPVANVSNLNITVSEILAGNTTYVGALAGRVENSNLINISVSGNNIVVGQNIVGGVAGLVTGMSRAININSNLSVSAVFSQQDGVTGASLYADDLYNFFEISTDVKWQKGEWQKGEWDGEEWIEWEEDKWKWIEWEEAKWVSERVHASDERHAHNRLNYVGGVFGIVDLAKHSGDDKENLKDAKSSLVSHITGFGSSKVIGENAGGLFGLIGAETYAANLYKIAGDGGYIKSLQFAGGIAAENRGIISFASVTYENDAFTLTQNEVDNAEWGVMAAEGIARNYFQGTPFAVGGLVGYSYGLKSGTKISGMIEKSYSRVHVYNTGANVAGGIVGVMTGGDLKSVYTTGSVRAGPVDPSVGGLVGAIYDFIDLVVKKIIVNPYEQILKDDYEYFKDGDPTPVNEETFKTLSIINFAVAMNNWSYLDFNYYKTMADGFSPKIGGLVGDISDEKLLLSAHNDASATNFFVSEIYALPTVGGVLPALTAGQTIELKAIGTAGVADILKAAKEMTPAEFMAMQGTSSTALTAKQKVFGGWDRLTYNITGPEKFPVIDLRAATSEIEVRDETDLRQIYWHMDKTYRLTRDIELKGGWTPLGDVYYPFTGTLESMPPSTAGGTGTAYTISGMTIDKSFSFYNGLFGATKNAKISNIQLKNVKISANFNKNENTYVGALVGKAKNTKFSNILIDAKITTNAAFAGGLVGHAQKGALNANGTEKLYYINNIIVGADIELISSEPDGNVRMDTTPASAGVLAGYLELYNVKGVYASGKIDATGFVCGVKLGGLVGETSGSEFKYTHTDVNIIDDEFGLLQNEIPSAGIGGFAGEIISSHITNSYAGGSISINIVKQMTNSSEFRVGGFAGFVSSGTFIGDSMAAGNITLDSGLATGLDGGTYTQVGGFVGEFKSDSKLYGTEDFNIMYSISIVSIRNFSLFGVKESAAGKVDAFTSSPLSKVSIDYASVYYDTYMALIGTSCHNELAKETRFFVEDRLSGEFLNSSGNFGQNGMQWRKANSNTKQDSEGVKTAYYVPEVKAETTVFMFEITPNVEFSQIFTNKVNANLGATTSGHGTKVNPIGISPAESGTTFAGMIGKADKQYYIQTTNADETAIPVDMLQSANISFGGFFNGNGYTLAAKPYASIWAGSGLQSAGKLGVFDSIGGFADENNITLTQKANAAFVTGVTVTGIDIDFRSTRETLNVGGLANRIGRYSIVASTSVEGNINVLSDYKVAAAAADSAINAGGFAAENHGQIINSASRVSITVGGNSAANIGGFAGVTKGGSFASYNGTYHFGSITDNTTEVLPVNKSNAGGFTGNEVDFAARAYNSYAVSDISKKAGATGSLGSFGGAAGSVTLLSGSNVSYDSRLGSGQTDAAGITPDVQRKNISEDSGGVRISWFKADNSINEGWPYIPDVDTINTSTGIEPRAAVATGNGDPDKPYLIRSSGQFEWMVNNSGTGKHFSLETDVNVAGYGLTSPNFSGTLLGNGHTVSGLTQALFTNITGKVHQLGIISESNTSHYALASETLTAGSSVTECMVESGPAAKGFVRTNDGMIEDCYIVSDAITLILNGSGQTKRVRKASELESITTYESLIVKTEGKELLPVFGTIWGMMPDSTANGLESAIKVLAPRLLAFEKKASDIDVSDTFLQGTYITSLVVEIATKKEFVKYANYINKHGASVLDAVINNDINFAGHLFAPINQDSKNGDRIILNGNGKTLLNLAVLGNEEMGGLFGATAGGQTGISSIKNLNLVNSVSYGKNAVGLLVGNMRGDIDSVIDIVEAKNSVVYASGDKIGGIAGNVEQGGKITSPTLVNCYVDGGSSVGGVAGILSGLNTISKPIVQNAKINYISTQKGTDIPDTLKEVGGIVGASKLTTNTISHTTGSYAIVADAATVVYGYSSVGGVAGVNGGDIKWLRSDAAVNAVYISGKNGHDVIKGYNSNIGGIVGVNSTLSNITEVEFKGTVNKPLTNPLFPPFDITTANNVGGIAGDNAGSISWSKTTGAEVHGISNVGGIAGLNSGIGNINNCTNNANVYGARNVGGIAGKVVATAPGQLGTPSVSKSANLFGKVEGRHLLWFPAGYCYETYNIGGLVGLLEGNLSESYVSGDGVNVSGGYNVGGLVGMVTGARDQTGTEFVNGRITYCYSLLGNTDSVSYGCGEDMTARNAGAFVGYLGSNSYMAEVFGNANIVTRLSNFDTLPGFTESTGTLDTTGTRGYGDIATGLNGAVIEGGSPSSNYTASGATVITVVPTAVPNGFSKTVFKWGTGTFDIDANVYMDSGGNAVAPTPYVNSTSYYYLDSADHDIASNGSDDGHRYILVSGKYVRLAAGEETEQTIYYRSLADYRSASYVTESAYWKLAAGKVVLAWQS